MFIDVVFNFISLSLSFKQLNLFFKVKSSKETPYIKRGARMVNNKDLLVVIVGDRELERSAKGKNEFYSDYLDPHSWRCGTSEVC